MTLSNHARRKHVRRGGGLSPEEVQRAVVIDHIIGPLDREVRRLNQKWGAGRLVEIVPLDLAEKYGKAVGSFEAAMTADPPDPETVKGRVANMLRGLAALDAAAEAAGETYQPEMCWSMVVDGNPAVLCMDNAARAEALRQRPDILAYTIGDVETLLSADYLRLVRMVEETAAASKRAEDAEHIAARKRRSQSIDEPIPF